MDRQRQIRKLRFHLSLHSPFTIFVPYYKKKRDEKGRSL